MPDEMLKFHHWRSQNAKKVNFLLVSKNNSGSLESFSGRIYIMFAVIRTGGKQYKVAAGDVIDVELIDAEAGKTAVFNEVLMIGNGDTVTVGSPTISGATVSGEVIDEAVKGEKVIAFKFKRRKGYHRTVGHRQKHTRVKIGAIAAK
jgi:large subunit ribosomal protein L21